MQGFVLKDYIKERAIEIANQSEVTEQNDFDVQLPSSTTFSSHIPQPPEGYFLGAEFTQEQLNTILLAATPQRDVAFGLDQPFAANNAVPNTESTTNSSNTTAITPSPDLSGHGTAVMGIAAGNGQESGGIYEGVAPESDLLVVKLGNPLPNSFPKTTELIQAIDYCVRKAMERNQPMALNISFGSSYGSREGNSLIEAYLNQVADLGRMVICVGMGNEGRAAGHTEVFLERTDSARTGRSTGISSRSNERTVELSVGRYQTAFNLQIWKNYVDEVTIELESPSGERIVLEGVNDKEKPSDTQGTVNSSASSGTNRYQIGGTNLLFFNGTPSPYSTAQELYLDFIPQESYIEEGLWKIHVRGSKVVDGQLDFYLPGGGVLNEDTRFLRPTPEHTLTIPSAAAGVVSVGAYDARLNGYANFSGRGYTREIIQVKPDLAAPGVNIRTVKAGGEYDTFSGTSFATPFVTGAAALLMEWGIVNGNEPYLYGEKVKAYLRSGARRLPGYDSWPNNELGYGVLCLRDSFPR